jgi:predicted dehydrogenase
MIDAGIVGLGWWGQVLVKSVQGKSDKIRFTKGAVRTPEKVADFAKSHDFELVDSLDGLLADKSIDAVVLATPHSLHRQQMEKAAKAGKHIFCEKPLTLSGPDSRAAADAARASGVVLAAGHNRRFHPAFQEMRKRVAQGALGDIVHVEGNMSSPGLWLYQPGSWRLERAESPAGGMAAMGLHIFDGMISMFGRIEAVCAQSTRLHRASGLDETTTALLRMENGMTGSVATSLATAWYFDFRVYGSNGWAEIRNFQMDKFTFFPREGEIEQIEFQPVDTERAELEAFADAVSGVADYPIPVDHAVHSTAVLRAIYDAAERKTWVDVD